MPAEPAGRPADMAVCAGFSTVSLPRGGPLGAAAFEVGHEEAHRLLRLGLTAAEIFALLGAPAPERAPDERAAIGLLARRWLRLRRPAAADDG